MREVTIKTHKEFIGWLKRVLTSDEEDQIKYPLGLLTSACTQLMADTNAPSDANSQSRLIHRSRVYVPILASTFYQ